MRSSTCSHAASNSVLYALYSRASSMSRTRETTSAARANASWATVFSSYGTKKIIRSVPTVPTVGKLGGVDFLPSISERRSVAAARVVDGRWASLGLAVLTALALSIRLDQPGWFDNEGRFAEVAREMLVRADWVTPTINFH